jgi:hypothetical protein
LTSGRGSGRSCRDSHRRRTPAQGVGRPPGRRTGRAPSTPQAQPPRLSPTQTCTNSSGTWSRRIAAVPVGVRLDRPHPQLPSPLPRHLPARCGSRRCCCCSPCATWAGGPASPRARAGPLRLRHLLVAAGLIAALSFPIPLAFPVNSWQPLIVHFWLLPQLAVLFVLGLAAGERGWLAGRPPPLVRRVCWLAPPSALAVLAGTVLATAVAGLYAALSGSARSPIPAVEPSEAELPRGVITKRLSWRCQVSPLLGLFHRRWAATQSSRPPHASSRCAHAFRPWSVAASTCHPGRRTVCRISSSGSSRQAASSSNHRSRSLCPCSGLPMYLPVSGWRSRTRRCAATRSEGGGETGRRDPRTGRRSAPGRCGGRPDRRSTAPTRAQPSAPPCACEWISLRVAPRCDRPALRLSRPWRRRACRRRAGVSAGAYLAVRVTLGESGAG